MAPEGSEDISDYSHGVSKYHKKNSRSYYRTGTKWYIYDDKK